MTMKTITVAITAGSDPELTEYMHRFGHLAANTITTYLQDIKDNGDRMGALAVLLNVCLATGDAIMGIKRSDAGQAELSADHVAVSAGDSVIDQINCSCGWKGKSYYDGREWAMSDWEKHASEMINKTAPLPRRVTKRQLREAAASIRVATRADERAFAVATGLALLLDVMANSAEVGP